MNTIIPISGVTHIKIYNLVEAGMADFTGSINIHKHIYTIIV